MLTRRFALVVLGTLALIPAAVAQTHGPVRLPPAQSAAADRLARQLVDGDTSRQVFTPEYAARRCYRAAKSNPSNGAGQSDRDGLTPRQRLQFIECVAADGFRLRRG
jgi:hypothetical protein